MKDPNELTSQDRSRACAICRASVRAFGEARMLGDINVRYFRCEACSFVQTESPHWLARAYASAITQQDLGLVARNLELADRTEAVVRLCHDPGGRFLDFGGGYGMLVRLLRDRGMDFHLHDPHCMNLFAGPAQIDSVEASRWELVTAFELLEHLENPAQEVERLMRLTDTLLCSTVLLPDPVPRPGEWHYYGLDHGQHISLFTRRALELLASRCGARFVTNGVNLHILTRARVPAWRHRLALGSWGRRIVRHHRRVVRLRNLTDIDVKVCATDWSAKA
jgi:hypothetical protein